MDKRKQRREFNSEEERNKREKMIKKGMSGSVKEGKKREKGKNKRDEGNLKEE